MIKTSIPRNLRTVDDWKNFFKKQIPELNPNWTNTSDEDLGMVLVTLISMLGDQLNFRYDMSILEAFLGSARERSNVQALLNLIGYTLSTYKTASVDVVLQYSIDSGAPFDTEYTIPKFSYIMKSSNPNIKYYTMTDLVIPVNSRGIESKFFEGTYKSEIKNSKDVNKYGRLYLMNTTNKIASNAIKVTYGGSLELTPVEDIYLSTEPYQFELLVDTYGQYYIQFDASWKEYINQSISEGVQIDIEYLITSGREAQVQKNYFDTLVGGSGPSELMILNFEPASGYADPESIENAQVEAPKYARTMKTAVTVADYEDLILVTSDEFLDAVVVDINYNGLPVDFVSFEVCKASMLSAAVSGNVSTTVVNYIFEIINEIGTADLTTPAVLEALQKKYEETGILGTTSVENLQLLYLNDDFLEAVELIATNIISIATGQIPTPVTTWQSGKKYLVDDTVLYQDKSYVCLTEHNSTTFNADIAKWVEVSSENEYSILKDLIGETLIDLLNAAGLLSALQNLIQSVQANNAAQNILNLQPYQLLIMVLTDNYLLTQQQKDKIKKALDEVRLATIKYEIQEPEIVNLDVYLTVAVGSAASANESVINTVKQLVRDYFSTLLIGDGFRLSKLLAYIHNNYALAGLQYILPSTTKIPGSTSVSQECTKLQIVRNGLSQPSVLNVEVVNV